MPKCSWSAVDISLMSIAINKALNLLGALGLFGCVITKFFPKTPEEPTHSLLTEVICELTFDCYAKTLFKILLKATSMHVIKIECYIKHTVDEHIIYWFPLANVLRSLSRDLYFN